MAAPVETPTAPAAEPVSTYPQSDIALPNGVVLTGAEEAVPDDTADAIEARHDALNPPPASAPKREPRGQKRIDQLTFEREEAVRRADAAEKRAKELEASVAQRPPAATATTEPAAQPAAKLEPTRAKPDEAEIGTKYATLSAYFEDLADWKSEQREAALLQTFDARLHAGIEADRASRTRMTHTQTVFAAGRAAYPDFDAALATVDDIKVSPLHQDAILKMPNAERILYALAKDRATLEGLVKETDPVMLGVKLASLGIPRTEAVAQAPPASTPVAVRTTNAPTPPQPVSGGSRTAQPSSAEIANSDGSYEAYKARRAAERGVH